MPSTTTTLSPLPQHHTRTKPPLKSTTSAPQLLPHRRPPLKPSSSTSSLLLGKRRALSDSDEYYTEEEGVGGEKGPRKKPKRRKMEKAIYSNNEILFPINRLYHSRPKKDRSGHVRFGLSSRHILTRLTSATVTPRDPALHLLKHIFPRQYGLVNVFTTVKTPKWAPVSRENKFVDRELEIQKLGPVRTPKRLKQALLLVKRLLKMERKCEYERLLRRFCPRKVGKKHRPKFQVEEGSSFSFSAPHSSAPKTQPNPTEHSLEVSNSSLILPLGGSAARKQAKEKQRFRDFVCGPFEVNAFVRAVVKRVVPRDFWGSEANEKVIYKHISHYLSLRRFESFSLHSLLQEFCIADCDWLRPPSASFKMNFNQKPNEKEVEKRKEILGEFLFWFFDGFLGDLIKTTFFITESSTSRNRGLVFRQDDWSTLTRPLLQTIQKGMFTEIPRSIARRILARRTLGFSYLRLLPKDTGARPIVNLQRRPLELNLKGKPERGKSINQHLENVFHSLVYEKEHDPRMLGASILGPGEVYQRLKVFKMSLLQNCPNLPRFYFVKVDVKACFDTIKQDALLELVDRILAEDSYRIQKYGRVVTMAGRVAKRWARKAKPSDESFSFPELATMLADGLRQALFSDNVIYPEEDRPGMLQLLRDHVLCNMIKIGGKFFKQKEGIPQGSVLSSLLCSLFYGHMEHTHLSFTRDPSGVLFRYIDDFLFITTNRPLAKRFLDIMDAGLPDYGCFTSPEKRLTNFDVGDGTDQVPRLSGSTEFPFCGMLINTKTLDVRAENERYDDIDISDTLTVETTKQPGKTFIYKMLQACKHRAHLIFTDTSHNSLKTVYLNVYQSFLLIALKFHAYVSQWKTDPRRHPKFFLNAFQQIVSFSFLTNRNRHRTRVGKKAGAEFKVNERYIIWLGTHAFHRVLSRKPTIWTALLQHLAGSLQETESLMIEKRMKEVVSVRSNLFVETGKGWRR